MMKRKRRQRYVIPALVEHNGQWEKIADFPDFEVYSDEELSKVLHVSTLTIRKWKKGGIIPFKPSPGCFIYNVNAVIDSLRAHGYHQETTGEQPTGHSHE